MLLSDPTAHIMPFAASSAIDRRRSQVSCASTAGSVRAARRHSVTLPRSQYSVGMTGEQGYAGGWLKLAEAGLPPC